MAIEKKLKKGQALKVKPETHRKKGFEARLRTKSRDQWTKFCREWSKEQDPKLRALSQTILTWGYTRRGREFHLPVAPLQVFAS